MFSQEVAIAIFVVVALVVFAGYFIFSGKSERLKGYRKNVLILVALVFGALYFFGVNHVYILNEDQTYEEKVLFLPAKFTLANNQQVSIMPKFGGVYSVIINNTQRDAVFETVVYGTAAEKPDVELPAQAVTHVNGYTNYIFKEPPNSMRVKGSGASVGWIHY